MSNYPTQNIELYAKDEEIERLKAELRKVETLMFSENYRLRDLLKRAADALDYQLKFINEHCCDGYPGCSDLIDELRKAAL